MMYIRYMYIYAYILTGSYGLKLGAAPAGPAGDL
jgi:hypothetical protein